MNWHVVLNSFKKQPGNNGEQQSQPGWRPVNETTVFPGSGSRLGVSTFTGIERRATGVTFDRQGNVIGGINKVERMGTWDLTSNGPSVEGPLGAYVGPKRVTK